MGAIPWADAKPACTPTGLFSTGVDDSGTPRSNGASEAHYTLTSAPPGGAASLRVITSASGVPYVVDDSSSAWIGPQTDEAFDDVPGNYTYETTFNIADGINPDSVFITGQWSADNQGLDILVNGVSSGNSTPIDYANFDAFTLTNGFRTGSNVLDFVINKVPDNFATKSTALRVEFSEASASIPEPSSLAFLVAGLSVLISSTGAKGRCKGTT
jgi:hypothetical protein